jgi:hypothetical protein
MVRQSRLIGAVLASVVCVFRETVAQAPNCEGVGIIAISESCECTSGYTGVPVQDGTSWSNPCTPNEPCNVGGERLAFTGKASCVGTHGFQILDESVSTYCTASMCTMLDFQDGGNCCPDKRDTCTGLGITAGFGVCTCNDNYRGVPFWDGASWDYPCAHNKHLVPLALNTELEMTFNAHILSGTPETYLQVCAIAGYYMMAPLSDYTVNPG